MNNLSKNYEIFVKNINIDVKTLTHPVEQDLFRMFYRWTQCCGVEIEPEFGEKRVHEFISQTYHDTDTYILYGFMLMKFFEYLLEFEIPWRNEAETAFKNLENAVLSDSKEDSIKYLRKVLGPDFPQFKKKS